MSYFFPVFLESWKNNKKLMSLKDFNIIYVEHIFEKKQVRYCDFANYFYFFNKSLKNVF